MTREEIIDGLEIYTAGRLNKDRVHITVKELQKFIDKIKALKQEPCEDVVSRQDALNCLTATGLKKFDFILDARNKIKNLPSVTPQQKWIPCSERLPEKPGYYLATVIAGAYQVRTMWYDEHGFWSNWGENFHVVAWMPLPEPYKEREVER